MFKYIFLGVCSTRLDQDDKIMECSLLGKFISLSPSLFFIHPFLNIFFRHVSLVSFDFKLLVHSNVPTIASI